MESGPPLNLLLVLHNHQPVGNLPEVFRQTFDAAYLPMVRLLQRHPSIRAAIHYTGPLLEWLEREEPNFLRDISAMQAAGQVEVLGGGLYEPILAVIPDDDKVGQMVAMNDRLAQLLGVRPRGAWLAERVWEPHLPRYFARAQISYTLLDQEHFEKAGLAPEEVDGAWITEDGGETVVLLPGSTNLRYLIPWRSVEEVMTFLQERRRCGQDLLVFADDGEKLGGWPGTHRHCYQEEWLERFFVALEQSAGWLHTDTPSQYLNRHVPRGRIYIPSASYPEMEDWSLPPATQQAVRNTREAAAKAGLESRFVRMGHWRGFLARYPESGLMQQRSTGISGRVHALPPGPRRDRALDQLWRGQCNCPYWHGVFGGIYLYHIRQATYGHLVAAERLAAGDRDGYVAVDRADVDADGRDEYRISTPEQSVFVHSSGGEVFEWDLPAIPLNLLNTLAAHPESYTGARDLRTGSRLRRAFLDHVLSSDPSVADVVSDDWHDQHDLGSEPWRLEDIVEDGLGQVTATWAPATSERSLPVTVRKIYRLRPGVQSLTADYAVAGLGSSAATSWLAVEISLALPSGAHTLGALAFRGRSYRLTETWEENEVGHCSLLAPGLTVELSLSRPARVIEHPLWSRHRTELGEEKVYQGTRVVLIWPLATGDSEAWRAEVTLSWSQTGRS